MQRLSFFFIYDNKDIILWIIIITMNGERMKHIIETSHSKVRGEERIDLISKGITQFGIRYLREMPWNNVSCIQLNFNQLWSHGAFELSRATFPLLLRLHLNSNKIQDKGVEFLIQANWKYLQVIELSSNEIGSEGAHHLSRSHWPNLLQISLDDNHLGPNGVKPITGNQWPTLNQLFLWNNNLGNTGVKYLTRGQWNNLQTLWLGNNQISDAGLFHLAKAPWRLTELNLNHNNITNQGFIQLKKCNNLGLIHLMINSNCYMNFFLVQQLLNLDIPIQRLFLDYQDSEVEKTEIRQKLKDRYSSLYFLQL